MFPNGFKAKPAKAAKSSMSSEDMQELRAAYEEVNGSGKIPQLRDIDVQEAAPVVQREATFLTDENNSTEGGASWRDRPPLA